VAGSPSLYLPTQNLYEGVTCDPTGLRSKVAAARPFCQCYSELPHQGLAILSDGFQGKDGIGYENAIMQPGQEGDELADGLANTDKKQPYT
jgi:hypothetical protein